MSNQLTPRDRVLLKILGGVGAGVLLLGYLQLAVHIKGSFDPSKIKPPADLVSQYSSDQTLIQSIGQQADQRDESLKNKDTDGDGLSDYDELYIYHTSPYLKDTDGDGIDDKTEIMNGTDPNCPQGKICHSPAPALAAPDINGDTSLSNVPAFQVSPPTTNSQADLEAQLRQAVPVSKLREMLIQQGLTKEQVDRLDDATLQKIYNDSLTNLEKKYNSGNTNSSQ